MRFPQNVADEVFVRCRRHCCLCGTYAGQKMELHHIIPVADGGDNSIDNCIPLCLNCHAEVKAYNPKHPKGRKFSEVELRGHRENCYKLYSGHLNQTAPQEEKEQFLFFAPRESSVDPKWGFIQQDKVCPILPGTLIMLAGESGCGKSIYVQNIVNANAQRGLYTTYCSLKESPLDIGYNMIAASSCIKVSNLKLGTLTEAEWEKLSNIIPSMHQENVKTLSYGELFSNEDDIISIVENSGSNIVVLDDLGGLFFNGDGTVERFMYRLKQAAVKSSTVVFVLYSMNRQITRVDKRPIVDDFPSASYYRLFDVIQFLFRPAKYYDDDSRIVEVITVKGAGSNVCTIPMVLFEDIALVASYDSTPPPETTKEELEDIFDSIL